VTLTVETDSATCRIHHSKIKMPELLKIEDSLVICSENKLEPFISYLDHCTILARGGMDVGLQDTSKFPDMVEGKYDLRIIESLLIQSR